LEESISTSLCPNILYTDIEELLNPHHIEDWYIDEKGKVVLEPDGRYNPKTGMVRFDVTHIK